MFGAVQFLNVLILTLLSDLFGLVKMAELSPVWERAADSACRLWFCCLWGCVCPSFSLVFGISFGF